MMRWIVGNSLHFRYLVLAFAVALMFFGIQEMRTVPMDVFPEFAPPYVEVQTEAPGMSATEVESLVSIQLEDVLSSTPQLDVMRSKSVPGVSSIVLIFKPDTDIMLAQQLVQERLNVAIRSLPSWAGIPWMLQPLSATSRVLQIGLTSTKYSLTDLSMIAYWTIRWHLMSVPGVANIVIWGNRFKQMQIQIDPNKLKFYNLSLDDVSQIASDALDFGLLKFTDSAKVRVGGFIETPNQRLEVQHILPVWNPSDLAKIVIPNRVRNNQSPLTLGDLGQVVWGHQPLIGDAVINGENGLMLIVEKFPWANTLEVTRGVEKALVDMQPGLSGIKINTSIFRPASFIEMAINNLTRSLIISCLFVVFVLGAFLYEWRTTLISLVTIPLSLVTAGVILHLWETTINTMILAGFVIAIGGVVDDAIIDVENILRRMRQHYKEKKKTSIKFIILNASLEIRGAIIYAVLIDIAVLIPVFFLQGVSGAFFRPLVTSYALALLASMIVALTVTPVLCFLLLNDAPLERYQSPLLLWLQRHYENLNRRIIHNSKKIIFVVLSVIILGICLVPLLGASLFPAFKERFFLIHWVSMPGTTDREVLRITKRLSDELRKIPGVLSFGSHIGRGIQGEEVTGINFAENWLNIDPNVDYEKTMETVKNVVRGYPGLFHDVQTYLNERIDEVVAGSSYPITVRIYGSDLNTLRNQAENVRQKLMEIEGTKDVHTEFQVDVPNIEVMVDTDKANRFGLKAGDIRRDAATLISGTEVSDIHRNAKVYGIIIWGTEATRYSIPSIQNLLMSAPNNKYVSLGEVAHVSIMPTPNLINREYNSRYIDVSLNITARSLSDIVRDVKQAVDKIKFPLGFRAEVIGEYQEREKSQNILLSVAIGSVIIVFLLLQMAFKSWRLSFLAFFTLPSALVGGILSTLLTGSVVSLGSLVGFFTVFGIAARNGIMLINHFQYIEKFENEPFGLELVLRGAKERLAPILMTASAAALALVPLIIFGDIPGQEIEFPMAIVILGGLVTSTVLNLFIVPGLYLWIRNVSLTEKT